MIDWARVTELKAEVGADDFSEIVAMFLEEADLVVARISPDLGAKALCDDCHFLKGAALNLGFRALAGLCQAGETRAAHGDVGADLDALRDCYAASCQDLFAQENDAAA
jgi:HPt (histidine-containing phosphotransfer) domain-containing protein